MYINEYIFTTIFLFTFLSFVISLINLYIILYQKTQTNLIHCEKFNTPPSPHQGISIKEEVEELHEKFYNKSDNGIPINGLTYNLPHSVIKVNDVESVEVVDENNSNTILEVAD